MPDPFHVTQSKYVKLLCSRFWQRSIHFCNNLWRQITYVALIHLLLVWATKQNTKTSLKFMLIFCNSANIQIIYVKAPTYKIFINMILIFVRKEASVKMPSHNHHHHHHHHHLCCHHRSVIIINAIIPITFISTPHQK